MPDDVAKMLNFTLWWTGQTFLSLCDLGSGSWELNSGRVRLLLADKGAGVMAMKIERKRIDF